MFNILSWFFKPVSEDQCRQIVPYECNDVGPDFIRQLAQDRHGIFKRDTTVAIDDKGYVSNDIKNQCAEDKYI